MLPSAVPGADTHVPRPISLSARTQGLLTEIGERTGDIHVRPAYGQRCKPTMSHTAHPATAAMCARPDTRWLLRNQMGVWTLALGEDRMGEASTPRNETIDSSQHAKGLSGGVQVGNEALLPWYEATTRRIGQLEDRVGRLAELQQKQAGASDEVDGTSGGGSFIDLDDLIQKVQALESLVTSSDKVSQPSRMHQSPTSATQYGQGLLAHRQDSDEQTRLKRYYLANRQAFSSDRLHRIEAHGTQSSRRKSRRHRRWWKLFIPRQWRR